MSLKTVISWFRKHLTKRVKSDLAHRLKRLHGVGNAVDGLHILLSSGIDDLDRDLLGCEIICAQRNNPDVQEADLIGGQWFTIKNGTSLSRETFWNSHGTSDDGGKTFYNETAYLGIVNTKYRPTIEEVVWYKVRVDQLRAENVPNDERIRIMIEERNNRAWESSL